MFETLKAHSRIAKTSAATNKVRARIRRHRFALENFGGDFLPCRLELRGRERLAFLRGLYAPTIDRHGQRSSSEYSVHAA